MIRLPATTAVFALSLCWFGLNVERSGISSAYCDPVSRIGTQDDAIYGREAIDIATGGNWLTPMYLGRFALNKPPLLQILSALSIGLFGISAWALRVPSLVAAGVVTALVFSWIRQRHGLAAAVGAALLLVSSHMFFVFSRLCMMDMMVTLFLTAAMFVLLRDPALLRPSSFWVFSLCSGAAILTKGAAGLLPLIALPVYAALAPKDNRPGVSRIFCVVAASAAVALPWHLYQLAVHRDWFVKEYVLTQHFWIGVTAPPQYSNENHLLFYARRLFWTDPALTLVALASSIPVLLKWRRNAPLLAWTATVIAALFAFRYRSAYYALPLIPAMALLAGELLSKLSPRARAVALAGLCACTMVKVTSASPLWGISWRPAAQEAAPALEQYCRERRGNDLILVDTADEFYAAALPLARVRYCYLAPPSSLQPRPLDLEWLGVAVTAAQFGELARWRPIFRARLASAGLPSDDPVATVILARSSAEIAQMIESHPDADFYIPEPLLRTLNVSSLHAVVPAGPARVFLLSPLTRPTSPARPCGF